MPCNIGYKSYIKAEIKAPEPQVFAEKSEAPEIDADLLEKLGVSDPEFLAWASELNTKPLLEEALKRTLAKVSTGGVEFSVGDDGTLDAKGRFLSADEKKKLGESSAKVTKRWQFEILGIVAELLDYDAKVTESGETLTLEAEEAGKSHPCDYIKVTQDGDETDITFEHFKSRDKLDLGTAKFLALADKLGVKIDVETKDVHEGDPFPGTHEHADAHVHTHGSDHGHKH